MLKKLMTAFIALAASVAFAAVDVNKADQAQLETVKGIGPALSERILTERKTGDFKDWSDLQSRVKGVGDKTAAKYSTQGLTVNGTAFAGAPAAAEAANGMSKKAADKAAKDMSKDVKK